MVALSGRAGTISEIALALKSGKKVILLDFDTGIFDFYCSEGLYGAGTPGGPLDKNAICCDHRDRLTDRTNHRDRLGDRAAGLSPRTTRDRSTVPLSHPVTLCSSGIFCSQGLKIFIVG